MREVNYEYSRAFLPILQHLQVSLLVSTYQAGKVAAIGCYENELLLSLHNFEKAMGIAVAPGRIAVGAKGIVWLLEEHSQLASQIEPVGKHDSLYLTKKAFVTGNIHGHEMAWSGDQLWIVNTLFSCLCTLHEEFSFVPQWQPPFVTELAGEDRCHLNGFCFSDGKPQYVTVMARSNELQVGVLPRRRRDASCTLNPAKPSLTAYQCRTRRAFTTNDYGCSIRAKANCASSSPRADS